MKSIGLVPELYVTDLNQSLDVYRSHLEFDILYERKDENFAYLKRENAELMLEQIATSRDWISGDLRRPFGQGINLQIEVSDIDTLYQKARRNSVKIFRDMEEKWYRRDDVFLGNRQFIVQDPDGYLLRFYQDLGTRTAPVG